MFRRVVPAGYTDPRFALSDLQWIADKANFTDPGYLEGHLGRFTFQTAESTLEKYISFRLKGIGLRRNDLNQQFRDTGVLDPLQDVCAEDHLAVYRYFDAFWLALHWLGTRARDSARVWDLVTMDPIGVPDFDSPELWLQRRAALITYDRSGMAPFEAHLTSVRPELFQFLALMRPITHEEKCGLLDALARLPEEGYFGDSFDLGLWLEEGDLQVGED